MALVPCMAHEIILRSRRRRLDSWRKSVERRESRTPFSSSTVFFKVSGELVAMADSTQSNHP